MASFEQVVSELKELNGTSEITLEAQFETKDEISALEKVLASFMNSIPAAILAGFQDLINANEDIYKKEKKDDDTREKIKGRKGDDGDGEKEGFAQKIKGSFKKGFEEDQKTTLSEDIFGGTIKKIEEVSNLAGAWSGRIMKVLSVLRVGLVAFGGAISTFFTGLMTALAPIAAALAPLLLPIAAIAAGVTALVMGIQGFLDGFQSQEGTLLDKIFGGISGFVKGFMKILTIPLDWMKDILSGILGFFGFDGAAEALDSFSFTELFGGLVDSIKEFVIGLKDLIWEKIKAVGNSIKSFFGFGDDEDEETNAKAEAESDKKEEEIKKEKEEESNKRGMDLGSTDTSMKEDGKRGMEIPRDSEKTYSVMTKSGMQKLTEEEIKQGRKDGTIKRSLAKEALEEIEDERKTEQILGKRGRVIGEAPAAPTKVSAETGKRGMVIGDAPVKTAAEKQIVADMQAGATPEEAVGKAMKVRKDALVAGTIEGTGAPVKVAGPKTVSARAGADALTEAEQLQASIDALKAEMAALGSAFDPENIAKFKEGLDLTTDEGKAEAKGRRDKFIEGQSEFTDKIKVLQAQKDKVMQTVDKAFGGSDDFDAALEGDADFDKKETIDEFLMRTEGRTPTKVKGGTIVSGGAETVRVESAEAKAERESAVAKEKKMLDAEKKAFAMLEQQGVIGADEFLDSDDPRMKQVAELAQKIFDGDLGPTLVGGQASAVAQSTAMSGEQKKLAAAKESEQTAANNVMVAPTNNSTSVVNTKNNYGPMPSAVDKSDRTHRGSYRGKQI